MSDSKPKRPFETESRILPILIIAWNVIDIGIHYAVHMIEPMRITGNLIGLVAALFALLGVARSFAPLALGIAALAVVAVNASHAMLWGAEAIVAVLIGISLAMLVRLAQIRRLVALSPGAKAEDRSRGEWWLNRWVTLPVTGIGLAIIFGVGSQLEPLGHAYASTEQSDTTPEASLPRVVEGRRAEILSAFFGLDNGLPRLAENLVRGATGMDGMPVIFSSEIDLATMQAGDFRVTKASGEAGFVQGATLAPAVDEGEFRTVLLVGEFGTAVEDPPVKVEIVGNVHSIDGRQNFKGAQVDVTPLADGPTMIFVEVVPQEQWHAGRRGNQQAFAGSGAPTTGVKQAIRVVWAGGVKLENGKEPGDAERSLYRVEVRAPDGSTREVSPIAIADLHDGDNNHLLCLDTEDRPVSVSFPAGILVDPNQDLNPETVNEVLDASR